MTTDDIGAMLHDAPYGVEARGPYTETYYTFTIKGYNVPYIRGFLKGERTWFLELDGRISFECEDDELHHWLPFLANAMAIAAGYTSFGEHCHPHNPFTSQMFTIEHMEATDAGNPE